MAGGVRVGGARGVAGDPWRGLHLRTPRQRHRAGRALPGAAGGLAAGAVRRWAEAEYLALLDRALLDRFLSVREQAGLVAAAGELGVDQPTAVGLHRAYLAALARAALADGVVTAGERDDLDGVARLLDLDPWEVDAALEGSSGGCGRTKGAGFWLDPGDMVVFTGEMSVPRPVWEKRAEAAGLVPRSAVTKKVKLVVAADPDSPSGKARKAADYGIPIVTEEAFAAMLERAGHV